MDFWGSAGAGPVSSGRRPWVHGDSQERGASPSLGSTSSLGVFSWRCILRRSWRTNPTLWQLPSLSHSHLDQHRSCSALAPGSPSAAAAATSALPISASPPWPPAHAAMDQGQFPPGSTGWMGLWWQSMEGGGCECTARNPSPGSSLGNSLLPLDLGSPSE